MQTIDLVKKIVEALEDKKAEDITVLDIGEVSSIADYFIIANGNNANQLTAMEDAVDEAMYTNGVHQKQVEGTGNRQLYMDSHGLSGYYRASVF